jgi:hypothetical protein
LLVLVNGTKTKLNKKKPPNKFQQKFAMSQNYSYSESYSTSAGGGGGGASGYEYSSSQGIETTISGGLSGGFTDLTAAAAGAARTDNMAADLLALARGGATEYSSSTAGAFGSASASGSIGNDFSSAGISSGVISTSGAAISTAGAFSSASATSGAAISAYVSEIEQSIIRSSDPIAVNESEEITVNGQRGIWTNRAEVVNWRGAIPINQYLINEDSNPEIITKRSNQTLDYIQELAIRYKMIAYRI